MQGGGGSVVIPADGFKCGDTPNNGDDYVGKRAGFSGIPGGFATQHPFTYGRPKQDGTQRPNSAPLYQADTKHHSWFTIPPGDTQTIVNIRTCTDDTEESGEKLRAFITTDDRATNFRQNNNWIKTADWKWGAVRPDDLSSDSVPSHFTGNLFAGRSTTEISVLDKPTASFASRRYEVAEGDSVTVVVKSSYGLPRFNHFTVSVDTGSSDADSADYSGSLRGLFSFLQ